MLDQESRHELLDIAYSNGYAFGRYAEQKLLSDEMYKLFKADYHLLKDYMQTFNEGFSMGWADIHNAEIEKKQDDF